MRTTMAVIRLADEADAGAMLAIYAPYVRETAISFELEPPSEGEFRRRVRSVLEAGLWLLCEAGGNALGYAYAGRFHERRAYRWTVEGTSAGGSARSASPGRRPSRRARRRRCGRVPSGGAPSRSAPRSRAPRLVTGSRSRGSGLSAARSLPRRRGGVGLRP